MTGQTKLLTFASALTLTYNATSLILPTGASIAVSAGDTATALALGSGNWKIVNYQTASGAPLSYSTLPAFSGDATSTTGSTALTLATVNAAPGSYGSATTIPTLSVDAKGRITAISNTTAASASSAGVVGLVRNGKMSVTAASASATYSADEVVVETGLGGTAYKLPGYNQTVNLASTGSGGMDTGSAPVSGFVNLYALANPGAQVGDANTLLLLNFQNNQSDSGPNGFSGALTGSPTFSASVYKVGAYSIAFPSGSYLQYTQIASPALAGGFTAEGWVYPTSTPGGVSHLVVIGQGSYNTMLGFASATTTPAFWLNNSLVITSSGGSVSLNTWHHLAVTWTGTVYTLWVDGVSKGTYSSATTPIISNNTINLNDSGGVGIAGNIGQFRLSNVSRYSGSFTPPSSLLTSSGVQYGIIATTQCNGSVYTGANMPTGYTASALLTTLPTNASSQFPILYAFNGKVSFPKVNALNITSSVPTTYTSVTLSNASGMVPPNAISISGILGTPGTANAYNAVASDANGTNEVMAMFATGSNTLDSFGAATNFSDLPMITAQTFYYKSVGSTNPVRVDVSSYRIY